MSIVHPQWRDSHRETAFPFSLTAALTTDTDKTLPTGAFLDGVLQLPGGVVPFHLLSIDVGYETATLQFGDATRDNLVHGVVDLQDPQEITELVDDSQRSFGALIGDPTVLRQINGWGLGLHTFRRGRAELAAAVCVALPSVGVSGLSTADGQVHAGDVWIVGERGVVVRTAMQSAPAPCAVRLEQSVVRVDVVGDPLFRRRGCNDEAGAYATPRVIRKIRFKQGATEFVCEPDQYGVIPMTASNLAVDKAALLLRVESGRIILEIAGPSPSPR